MNTTTSVPSQDVVASAEPDASPEIEFFEEYTCESFGYATEEDATFALKEFLEVTDYYHYGHFFHEVQFDDVTGKWGYVIYGSSE
jgi:hypothetical protein